MISIRTVRVIKIILTMASSTGFLPYKWDSINQRIRKSERCKAELLSNIICSWETGFVGWNLIMIIYNMATRVREVPEMILGILVVSLFCLLVSSFVGLIVIRDEAIVLFNSILQLTEQLGKLKAFIFLITSIFLQIHLQYLKFK